MPLVADLITHDPDFQKGKERILKAVAKHSNKLTQIAPPQTELHQSYEETLAQLSTFRGAPLFYPYLGSGAGNGALVELADGSVKYDFISGVGVHFGHCHPTLIEASLEAAVQDIAMQGNLQQNRDAFALMKLLVETSKLDHCVLTTSGAMANENALKMIFQKRYPAHRILAFERCFIGRTLSLAQITDRPAFREGLPHNLHVDYLPFYDWRNPKESTRQALSRLHTYLHRHPGQYACMCFEMIQGEGGVYPGNHEFFMAIIELLKEHKIAVLVDEVQSFGRTDQLFAFQSFGLQEVVDVVTIGKLAHTCATLYRNEFQPRPGLITQTYLSATSSIRVAHAIIDSLLNDGYLGLAGKNMQIRKHFVDHLQRLAEKYPDRLEGPYGYGLMIGVTALGGERERVIALVHALFEAGLIAFIAGQKPTRLRFLIPAGGITFEAIDQVAEIFEEVLCQQ